MTSSIKIYRFASKDFINRNVWSTTFWEVTLVVALYIFITAPYLLAGEQNQTTHHEAGNHHENVFELFAGNTHEDTHHGSENGFTVGFTYERRFSALWGVGGSYEYAAGDFDKWSISVPLFVHPYKGWRFQLAPGLEHKNSEDEFLLRIGAAYEVMLSERWMLIPEIAVDFVDSEEAFVYGLAVGFGF